MPQQLDLGQVPLGESLSHQLHLSCMASVGFGYTITVVQHNTHFTVAPLSGTIPAHGRIAVTVTFTPTRYSTEHLQLLVQLSEYGAGPSKVMVTASCRPGLVQQRMMVNATQEQQMVADTGKC